MKKIILILGVLFGFSANASEYGIGLVDRVYTGTDNMTLFGLKTQQPNTCVFWSEHFIFDSSTSSGKNMLSIILAAKMANKSVHVWYEPSSAPGTNQTNGCDRTTLSVLNSVGVR